MIDESISTKKDYINIIPPQSLDLLHGSRYHICRVIHFRSNAIFRKIKQKILLHLHHIIFHREDSSDCGGLRSLPLEVQSTSIVQSERFNFLTVLVTIFPKMFLYAFLTPSSSILISVQSKLLTSTPVEKCGRRERLTVGVVKFIGNPNPSHTYLRGIPSAPMNFTTGV